jgi:hypothetical protein
MDGRESKLALVEHISRVQSWRTWFAEKACIKHEQLRLWTSQPIQCTMRKLHLARPVTAATTKGWEQVGLVSMTAYLWYSLSLLSSSETSCKWSWKPRKVLIHIPLPFRERTHHNLHATKPPTPRNLQRFASASKAATSMCVHRTVYTILDK